MQKPARIALIVGVAAIAAVAAVGVYALLPQSSAPATGCAVGITTEQPIGITLAWGASVDAATGPNHWYNFTIEAVSPNMSLGLLSFELKSSNGTPTLLPTGGVAVATPGPSSLASVGAIFILGGSWTYEPGFSPATILTTNNFLSLFFSGSTPHSLVGDDLFATGCFGTVSGPVS